MLKRCLTAIIGLPIVIAIILFANKYVVDVIVAILAVSAIYEYMKCVKHKFKPVMWIGFVIATMIAFIHVIPYNYLIMYVPLGILTVLAILFMHVVFTDMKINAADIAITLFGIIYIVGFLLLLLF